LLGAAISAVELPTAFIYFGAVSAIVGSEAGVPERVLLVVAYNAVFVLPLIAILGVRALVPDGGAARLRTANRWLRRCGPVALAAVVAAAGATLVTVGLDGMLSA
jgi:cytochrome c biogenesis protein CcdA